MPAKAGFCRRCGTDLASVSIAAKSSPQAEHPVPAAPFMHVPRQDDGGRGRHVMAVAFVAAVAVGVAVLLTFVRSSRRSTSVQPQMAATLSPPMSRPAVRPPSLPPLPPLPTWRRHLPAGMPTTAPAGAANDYRGQILTQGHYAGQKLPGAVFAGTDLVQGQFEDADLTNADFRGAHLTQAHFGGADLTGTRFDEAWIHQASFVGVDTAAVAGKTRVRDGITEPISPPPLPAKNAGRASFQRTRFSQTKMEGLDLAGADFRGAEFSQSGFRNADLSGADLRDTRHHSTDFEGAKLDGADMRGADLTSARYLTDAQLATAKTDATTRRPFEWK